MYYFKHLYTLAHSLIKVNRVDNIRNILLMEGWFDVVMGYIHNLMGYLYSIKGYFVECMGYISFYGPLLMVYGLSYDIYGLYSRGIELFIIYLVDFLSPILIRLEFINILLAS